MTPRITHRLGHEVLQPSALHDFEWPQTDPILSPQSARIWTEKDDNLVDAAVRNTNFRWESFLDDTCKLSVADQLWRLLTHRVFNFNGVTAVRGETYWADRVRAAVANSQPVDISYPLVCKINNPAKRLTTVGCTAAERATVKFFRDLGEFARRLYAPGIVIHVLSDATLYNSTLQVPPPTAYAYMKEFSDLIEGEVATETVVLHDYAALLAPFAREFESSYNEHFRTLDRDPMGMLANDAWCSLPSSVRASINTRRCGFEYDELKDLFGPSQVRFRASRSRIDAQALYGLQDQLAIKMACDDVDLPQRLWPLGIRASCHKGKKRDRHVLGLRPYPEYYGASKLLPYHGMPLIEADSAGRPRLVVLPEIILRGRSELMRVTNAQDDPLLYVSSQLITNDYS